MGDAWTLTDNLNQTYTYEGKLKTKNETGSQAISITITDNNGSTILTENVTIQNYTATGFGTGPPAVGSYYCVFSVAANAYWVESNTNYSSLGYYGSSQYAWYNTNGQFTGSNPSASSMNPMVFYYGTLSYNGSNITSFFATTYNGSSFNSYANRNFPAGHSTGNMSIQATGNTDEYYMATSNYQMRMLNTYMTYSMNSGTFPFSNTNARFKFYRVA